MLCHERSQRGRYSESHPKGGKNCPNLIRELPSLTYDANNPEDIDQNCASDHCYDALRYGLTRRKISGGMVKVKYAF
jgi:hypothetical protein